MVRIFLLPFSLLFSISLYAADIYKGTIGGNTEIVLLLQKDSNGAYSGRYFYQKYKRDIFLSGSLQRLEEKPDIKNGMGDSSSYWKGKIVDHSFIGTWNNLDMQKKLPLRLAKIGESIPAAENIGYWKHSEYDLLKMRRDLKKGSPIKVADNLSYQWVTDSITSLKYPLIVDHPSKIKKERLNKFLMSEFWHYALNYDSCDSVPSVNVNYLSTQIFDITESGSIFCGGAHPTNFVRPRTFDFSTGKEVLWSSYLEGVAEAGSEEKVVNKDLFKSLSKSIQSHHNWQKECDSLLDYDAYSGAIGLHVTKDNIITVGVQNVAHALTPCLGDYAELPISTFTLLPKKLGEGLFE